jgi:hypothetical protein
MAAFHRQKKNVPVQQEKTQPPAEQEAPVEAAAEKKTKQPRKKKGA